MSESEHDLVNVQVLEALVQAFNRQDVDAVMELFTEDCVFESPRGLRPQGRRIAGRDGVRQAFAGLMERFPDARYSDVSHWVCSSKGVTEWKLVRREFDEEILLVRGCDLWVFRDGKIATRNSFWKMVVPPEGSARPAHDAPQPPS